MATLTLKSYLPGAQVKLWLWGQAEPYRQRGEVPSFAPELTATADANGATTFTVTTGIIYAAFDGKTWRTVLDGRTKVSTPVPAAKYERTDVAKNFAAKGVEAGFTGSAYPKRPEPDQLDGLCVSRAREGDRRVAAGVLI